MMNEIFTMHLIGGAITLYMLLIALRWFAPYLEFDLAPPSRRWMNIADPPIELARRLIGQTAGPFDWAPIAVLLVLWIIRVILAGV